MCSLTSGERTCSLTDLEPFELEPPPEKERATVTPVAPQIIPNPNPVHHKPTWNFPTPLPAAQGLITYADGKCENCKKDKQHTISESARSRWAAVQIHAYLSGVLAIPTDPGFMVGVLVNEQDRVVCVAYSSNNANNADATLNGCKFTGYKLNLYGNEGFADISTCRGGKDISKYRPLSMVNVGKDGLRSSETCAASKLVKKFIEREKLPRWNMTEIAYGTMTGYTDGVPATSCIGCQNFLPTLICGATD